jgi:Zn-dependent protease with chaperone function
LKTRLHNLFAGLNRLLLSLVICGVLCIPTAVCAQESALEKLLYAGLYYGLAKQIVHEQSHLAYVAMVDAKGELPATPTLARVKARLEQTLGQRLSLKVLNDDSFNASAYATGEMFINRRTLDELGDDEAALAGILGHEYTHFNRQHSVKQFQKQILVNTGLQLLLKNRDLNNPLVRLAAQGVISKFSRDDESEADRLGFVLAVKSGYDPDGPARAMETIERLYHTHHDIMTEILADHPPTPNRIATLRSYAAAYRNKVPLEWIAHGKTTKDLEEKIGKAPDVIIATSPFTEILMNRPADQFRISDSPRFAITAKQKGYLVIVDRAPDGTIRQVFPNPYHPSGDVDEGEKTIVPDGSYRETSNTGKSSKDPSLMRLRWDQKGDYQFYFILTERTWSISELAGKKMSDDTLLTQLQQRTSDAVLVELNRQTINVH